MYVHSQSTMVSNISPLSTSVHLSKKIRCQIITKLKPFQMKLLEQIMLEVQK
jgi:hypothetical protein